MASQSRRRPGRAAMQCVLTSAVLGGETATRLAPWCQGDAKCAARPPRLCQGGCEGDRRDILISGLLSNHTRLPRDIALASANRLVGRINF